jgi:hypothetical protein
MIFIFYPSMIVKDAQRYSVFCQTITFHQGMFTHFYADMKKGITRFS